MPLKLWPQSGQSNWKIGMVDLRFGSAQTPQVGHVLMPDTGAQIG
jgi:hypothetical protein